VLDADGVKSLDGLTVLRAVDVLKPHFDLGWPLHFVREARHRDAALHMSHGLRGAADDFGIDVGKNRPRRQFQHKNTLLHADMGGGDADTRGGAHRVDQVADKILQLPVKHRDRLADFR